MKNENLPITARIDRFTDGNGNTKAFASVTIAESFAVHGLRVIEKDDNLIVGMPSRSYKSKGEIKFTDTFHPITTEARSQITDAVKEAYEQALEKQMAESERGGMDRQM